MRERCGPQPNGDFLSISKIRNQLQFFLPSHCFVFSGSFPCHHTDPHIHSHVCWACLSSLSWLWFAHIQLCTKMKLRDKTCRWFYCDCFAACFAANHVECCSVIYGTKQRGTVNNVSERPWNDSFCLPSYFTTIPYANTHLLNTWRQRAGNYRQTSVFFLKTAVFLFLVVYCSLLISSERPATEGKVMLDLTLQNKYSFRKYNMASFK